KLPPVGNSLNSQNNKKAVSNKFSVERGRKEFILKTSLVYVMQIFIVWEVYAIVILVEKLRDWLKASFWFSWLCG
ncbi:unnamed protein product, partial [Trichobilharzia szidati]